MRRRPSQEAMTSSEDPRRAARDAALRLLARREYAGTELQQRLTQRGCSAELACEVVAELASEGLQSNERFAEALVRSRHQRGHGPLRIVRDLRDRGVESDLIATYCDVTDASWTTHAREVLQRRFGLESPQDYPEWAKRARFLQSRGFTERQVRAALGDEHE